MTDGTSVPLVLAGRYRLDRAIGRGGMGVVWLGHDEVLGRAVALKRMGAERSQQEARLAARLQHPHVVAVYDLVEDPAEGAFLVMEYVEGTTLAGLVRERGALPAAEALPLLEQVADGLAAATMAEVTHRDVKPSNVLVQADGTAKLSDFGIARAATDATVTQTGVLMGSPAYVAPEVGAGGRADHAADVWSFGATAYFLVAGAAPYEADNPLATLYRIVHEEPPAPPVDGPLATLIAHTMVKDPTQRWSIGRVHRFLVEACELAAAPVVTGPPHPATPAAPADPAALTGPTRMLAAPPPAGPPPGPPIARVLPPVPASAPPGRRAARPAGPRDPRPSAFGRRPSALLVAGVVLALVLLGALALGLHAALSGKPAAAPRGGSTPTRSAPSSSRTPAAPTAAGMEAFIRSYVRTVSDNPDAAWSMLTPKFQAESGGLAHYRAFWERARNGRVLDITANPRDLVVSYHVHFDDFDNGPGPTVLELAYRDGRYRIDGETTKGFTPSG